MIDHCRAPVARLSVASVGCGRGRLTASAMTAGAAATVAAAGMTAPTLAAAVVTAPAMAVAFAGSGLGLTRGRCVRLGRGSGSLGRFRGAGVTAACVTATRGTAACVAAARVPAATATAAGIAASRRRDGGSATTTGAAGRGAGGGRRRAADGRVGRRRCRVGVRARRGADRESGSEHGVGEGSTHREMPPVICVTNHSTVTADLEALVRLRCTREGSIPLGAVAVITVGRYPPGSVQPHRRWGETSGI